MLETHKRSMQSWVKTDLDEKIVLISGPRQTGKTTMAKQLYASHDYLNYDDATDREVFIEKSWRKDVDVVILDEIHKHREWKRFIKGVYDKEGVRPRLLVTGSAKLDTYRKVGDSLAGRYFRYRLYPFDLKELMQWYDTSDASEILNQLLTVGGFPEPFLKGSDRFYKKWRKTHLDIMLRQDLLDLEDVRYIQSIELLIQLLRSRVGSPISYALLAKDLHHSPVTIKKWLTILEQLYIIFTVRPYHRNVAQAVLKSPKYYFYDIGLVEDDGAKLENLVALSLLKNLHYDEDTNGDDVGLHYIRTKAGKEVDFCVVKNKKIHLVEVKVSDENLSSTLSYFNAKLAPESATQVVKNISRERHFLEGPMIVSLDKWLLSL